MAEIAGSVGIIEATAPPDGISFVDGDGGDAAATILDEVLSGVEAPADAPAETDKQVEAKPDAKPEAAPVAEPPETVKLRKGFAKLAEERQRLIERETAARDAVQRAEQFSEKARRHDELVSSIEKDPAAFILAHGGEALVNKTLQGFIDQEKSPAEREIARFRQEQKDRDATSTQREQTQLVERWRNDIAAKVQADERFDLVNTFGLHGDVIDVITSYYEKHSERDGKGNVTVPAVLPWDLAAEAVENDRAAKIETSKRYGKRAPAVEQKKDAPPAKQTPAPAKRASTSLSVQVAESPQLDDDLPTDPDERQSRLLAEFGF